MFGTLNTSGAGLIDQVRRMEREMNQLFGGSPWPSSIRSVAEGAYPPINIGSTPDQVDVYLFAAGLNPDSLDISIQQNLLTVVGDRNLQAEEGADYYRKERYDGGFRRVVNLPDDVDPDQVEASYRDGVLQVTVKRREAARPRQISVK